MENQLSKYLNQSLVGAIHDVRVIQGTAKETGNLYYCIELTFINGFQKRLFLKQDEQFAWCNAFDLLNEDDSFIH